MTQPAKVQEPSMEEILASIRRIISDDEAKPAKPPVKDVPPSAISLIAARAATVPAKNQDDVEAILTGPEEGAAKGRAVTPPQPNGNGDVSAPADEVTQPVSPPVAASSRLIEPHANIDVTDPAAPKTMQSQPTSEPAPMDRSPSQAILSRSTENAVESAFSSLASTVLSNNPRTLEDLVKEMLRPMLKSWLDDNLPGLVERMVKAEIERLSRGR